MKEHVLGSEEQAFFVCFLSICFCTIKFVFVFILFIFLAALRGMWNLTSLTKD